MHSDAQGDKDRFISTPMTELLSSITALIGVTEKGMAKVMAPYDLTTVEFNCLNFCLNNDKETTATEMASHMPIDASRVSRIVNTLVDKGMLVRRRLRTDRRIVMLSLSKEGKGLTVKVRQSVNRFIATLTAGINEGALQEFVSVASSIIANHDAMNQVE